MNSELPPTPARSRRVAPWVFAILLASYACFWHTRDWNAASRLMLTYAIVDRGTVTLDGLERQTGDRASFQGHAYSDKLPGFSLLAAAPYALAKSAFRLPDHPLNRPGFPLWRADYWTTLGTAGLATAGTGALLCWWATALGCGPRRAALVGLAYGLATPAYVYATLAYGHQLSAFALLSSFTLIEIAGLERRSAPAMVLAGFAAATASLIDLQVAPVSAILGFHAVFRAARERRGSWVAAFAIGALPPSLTLLGYNVLAFGSPFDMGYFHHAVQRFRDVHSTANPLGLRLPEGNLVVPLLVGRRRGLLLFAPILLLALPGWVALARHRRWGVAIVSMLACAAIFAVNLSYPEWTGGWSTGPRLLVPLLPFAMLPVAGLLAVGGRGITVIATTLTLVGAALMLMCQGVDGRIPEGFPDPLLHPVLSTWRGNPLPWGPPDGEKPGWNPVTWIWSSVTGAPPPSEWWLQFAPLVAIQAVLIAALFATLRVRVRRPPA